MSIAETNSSHCTDNSQVSTHNGTAQTMQQQQQHTWCDWQQGSAHLQLAVLISICLCEQLPTSNLNEQSLELRNIYPYTKKEHTHTQPMASMAGSHLCNSISRKAQPRQLEQLFKLAYSGSPSSMAISHCRCEHLVGGSRRHSCRRFETDAAGTASAHSLAPASTTVVAWHLHSLGDTTAFHGCLPAAAFGCSPVDAFVCLAAAAFAPAALARIPGLPEAPAQ